MNRLPTALLLLLAVLAGACGGQRDGEDRRSAAELTGAAAGWNVVVISVDTLRADRLGAWGYDGGYGARPNSPEIDALVARGVRFDNAHAPRALTWPSLASMLTGLAPSGHGLVANGLELADRQPTLPTLLRAAGYRTAAFLSNMCRANHAGWDAFSCGGGVDRRVNREALGWLSERNRSAQPPGGADGGGGEAAPFLLWVHYFGSHPPYYNGGERARRDLDPGYEGVLRPKKGVLDRVMTEPLELDQRDLRHLDAIYDAAVMGTDHYVGELLDALARHADLDRTLIVFLADHGEDLYDHHRYLYHACSVYQTSLHVPLALVAPGLLPAAAGVLDHVELVDVLPTLIELLGVEPPACMDGQSLVGLLEEPPVVDAQPAGTAYGEYGTSGIHTWVDQGLKLVMNPDREQVPCMQGVDPDFYPIAAAELYDLLADPGETTNLAEARPHDVARLRSSLAEHRNGLCRPAMPGATAGAQRLPEDVKRQLEELGYVVETGGGAATEADEKVDEERESDGDGGR